ncbi:MAG TPA: phosphoenolpyruvate--protein phosphotransferase [Burkholderiales bacterium]|nr:phosphoenolpyruvate--protein phosphotransferase [Burkholderiales bacterium]
MGKPELDAKGVLLAPCGASFTLHGAGVSDGVAIGTAHLITTARLEAPHYEIDADQIEAEIERFDAAVATVRGQMGALQVSMPASAPAEMSAFLDLHLMILKDSMLAEVPRDLIRVRRYNAEWALVQQMETLVQRFDEIEDAYLRERKADIEQVVERVLKVLMGSANQPAVPSHEENIIVVAHDFSPADMILFKQHQFAGFVTDLGGVTSHTAIVARSLNLPAIVGLHHARHMIREGELLIVDGAEGVLIINPDPLVLNEYRLRQSEYEIERQKLKRLKSTPATTIEGTPIELQANIELPQDVDEVLEAGATGIGLYRSEFLFLNRDTLPSEDEQFEAYRSVVEAMQGRPVTIRTLDIGADKALESQITPGPNPALGLRAIRFCLSEPQMFMTQLRALYRASHYGKVRLLIPMIAHLHEIDQTLGLIRRAQQSLRDKGIPFDETVPVGGMIEVPAAALALGQFVKRLDFLSIGTNDLIQYTLAIDRTDDAVAHLYDPLHPAVLYLIGHTIRIANRAEIPVAVCGEMAGQVDLARLLLGLGLRQFSMHPAQLPAVKQQILRSSISEAEVVAQRILRSEDPERARMLLERLNNSR